MVVEASKLVVATATYFVVVEDEVLARFGNNRTEAYLKGLMPHETFGHDVLDWFPLSRRAAEHAGRHATNLMGRRAAFQVIHPGGGRSPNGAGPSAGSSPTTSLPQALNCSRMRRMWRIVLMPGMTLRRTSSTRKSPRAWLSVASHSRVSGSFWSRVFRNAFSTTSTSAVLSSRRPRNSRITLVQATSTSTRLGVVGSCNCGDTPLV